MLLLQYATYVCSSKFVLNYVCDNVQHNLSGSLNITNGKSFAYRFIQLACDCGSALWVNTATDTAVLCLKTTDTDRVSKSCHHNITMAKYCRQNFQTSICVAVGSVCNYNNKNH